MKVVRHICSDVDAVKNVLCVVSFVVAFCQQRKKTLLHKGGSELRDIVQNSHLLTRLERREANIWAVSTAERISKRTAAATARLALHSKVQLVQVLALELQRAEVLIGFGATGFIFGLEALGETAGAVFAGAAFLAGDGGALGGCVVGERGLAWAGLIKQVTCSVEGGEKLQRTNLDGPI